MTQDLLNAVLEIAPKSQPRKRIRPLGQYKQAIADFLVEYVRWLDFRLLWRSGQTTFFRVNFWSTGDRVGDARITRSAFLAVEESSRGLRVRDLSHGP